MHMAFNFELLVCLLISIIKASQSQVQCFDQCGNTAVTLSLTDNTATCCNSGGGAFIDVLNEGAECQECVDLGTLQGRLSITSSTLSLGDPGILNCSVSSQSTQNLNSNLQWIGPDGTVLRDVDSETFLVQGFSSLETSDFGDYTCISTISSPDFPGVTSTFSSTVSILPQSSTMLPTTIIPSSPSRPSAGEDYSLQCVVVMEGVTIQWTGPDGMIVTSGEGITVGDTMSSAGQTTSTLTFSDIATSRTGRYTCQNSVEPRSTTLIVDIPVPTIEITDTDLPPEIGEPYTPNCFGSVPLDLEGSVTVSWITPNGDVVDTITSDDNASLPLSFVPFEEGDVGQYICQVRVTSRFLNGPVGTRMSVTLALVNTVVPPTTGPIGTDPSTTTASPPLTTMPAEVDECDLRTDNCSRQRVCRYSYTDRKLSRVCRQVANCTDTPTGFQCTCNEGFSGDGILCRDVNECARNLDDCHPDAKCQNTAGGFRCRCKYSYVGDGVGCCIKKSAIPLFDRDATGRSSSTRSSRSSRSTRSTSHSTSGSKSTSKSSSSSDSDIETLDPKCREVVDAYLSRKKIPTTKSKSSRSKSSRSKSSKRRG